MSEKKEIEKKKRPKITMAPSLILDEGDLELDGKTLVEEVILDGKPVFALYDGTGVRFEESWPGGTSEDGREITILPRWDDVARKGLVRLPNAALLRIREKNGRRVIGLDVDTEKLIDDLREHIKKYLDVSDDFLEFSIWYILLTWVYDRLSTLPYLRALGDYGTGKSRFLDVVGGLCYRSIHAGGATSAAAVARLIELWKGTLIYNEADWQKSDEAQDIVKILNEGFEKRRGLIKAHKEDQKKMVVYDVFGPKILATRKTWYDPALESRCITEIMRETKRTDIPPLLTKDFYDEQEELRARLLTWRFANWNKVDEQIIMDILPKFGENLEKRLIQASAVFSVLFSYDERMIERFKAFLENHQRGLIEERASSYDGAIVNAIYALRDRQPFSSSDIATKMEDFGFDDVKTRTVGMHLRSLGLETKNTRITVTVERDGEPVEKQVFRRALVWDEGQLKSLFKRYVPDFCGIKASVASVTNTRQNDNISDDVQQRLEGGVLLTHATNAYNATEPFSGGPIELYNRLVEIFGVLPFKPSQLLKHFSDDELEAVNSLILKLKEEGRIVATMSEAGVEVMELVLK